ncbi:MAG: homogentisate 1,2-dioxygenase [bacterium]|nr:homogentisate 1,2-dioxygenase [bacterium]
MSFYHVRGCVPRKKHTVYYKEDQKSIHYEELTSSIGFDGVYSTKYHLYGPTQVEAVEEVPGLAVPGWDEAPLMCYHFNTEEIENPGDFVSARSVMMYNANCSVGTAIVTENSDSFYKNAYGHEMIFVHKGKGTFRSEFGTLDIKEGDHIVIPKGTICQLHFDDPDKNNAKLFIVESDAPFEIPRKYRNEYGQILEHAPYSERDFHAPQFVDPIDQKGNFSLKIKAGDRMFNHTVDHHPYDLVGWDGYLYPFTFNIDDFQPIVGQIHLPPPIHQLFHNAHFVVCNFVPRLYDFHPQAVPAPYFHSNVDSDEILYYVEGHFMSRKGIKEGSITLHPTGIPHGPQPGRTEESIGKKETQECAVMVDTFAPLKLTTLARDSRYENYFRSWVES